MTLEVLFYSRPWKSRFLISKKIISFVLSFFPDLGVTVSSGLVASVQSLVAILQQQIDTNGHQTPADSQNATTLQNVPADNVISYSSVSSSLSSRASVVSEVDNLI